MSCGAALLYSWAVSGTFFVVQLEHGPREPRDDLGVAWDGGGAVM